jgi:hypothetical protein
MNDTLQKIMNRCFTDEQGERFDHEQFAELIVRECAMVARTHILETSGLINSECQSEVITENKILKHFNINK